MLQMSNTPRLARDDLLMARSQQQQIRQHGDAKGLLDPSLVHTDLVLAQPEVCLQLAIDLFHRPPSLVRTHHLSRDPLVQIGHQDFRMFGADVSPFFTQHHSDVADVPQTQTCAIHPEGFAARGSREAGHARALIIFARHMRHPVLDGLLRDRFPCPGHRTDTAPAPRGILRIALADPLPMLLGALGGITRDTNPHGPRRWHTVVHHLTAQRMFRAVLRMGLGPNEAKGHGEAIAVPRGDQQRKAHPKKPRLMLAFTPLLGHRILRPPLGFHTAIAHEKERPVLGWGQGVEGFLPPPLHQQMDIPVGRLEQATKAPGRDRARRPTGKLFQCFPPWEKGLHDDEPTEHETVTPLPQAGHAAKQDRNKKGQGRDTDHSRQPRERSMGKQKSSVAGLS